MSKSIFNKSILVILLVGISLTSALSNYSSKTETENQNSLERYNNISLETAQNFELLQDFEASTYFISPNSSEGRNDAVFFSFMANKRGNFTIQAQNHPNYIDDTELTESHISFDNPYGTNIWYIAYSEIDTLNLGRFNIRLLKSEDNGKTWSNSLISSIYADIENPLDYNTYVSGISIATNPKTGFLIVLTWINKTNLSYFRSFDNGTTWEGPEPIFNSTLMGTVNIFKGFLDHPRMDAAILENGSVIIVSEATDKNFFPFIFIESPNNGTEWNLPKNVTCVNNLRAKIPKIQVDYSSKKYWLMWKYDSNYLTGGNDTIQWAEFNETHNFYADVQYLNVSNLDLDYNFDFYYDHHNDKFRIIYCDYDYPITYIENWTCEDFSANFWVKTRLGSYTRQSSIISSNNYLHYVYSKENYLFFLEDYIGKTDIYQFKVIQDYIYWEVKGTFNENELIQIPWDGRKSDSILIEDSLVKIIFTENYTGTEKFLFITIDNEIPDFMALEQKRHYFNPLSTNITLSNIPWEILPSESCELFLEVLSNKTQISSWSQIVENNWDDNEPKIFISDTRIIYCLYESLEAGRSILYLIKSYDLGVTWSNPIKVYETTGGLYYYTGAAIGSVVLIYIYHTHYQRILYRSFDEGFTFRDEINIYDATLFPSSSSGEVDFLLTRNGTMFSTFKRHTYGSKHTEYYILKSNDLGNNWTFMELFNITKDYNPNLHPKLTYDFINDIVYLAMPLDNYDLLSSFAINFSFSTFNFNDNKWSVLESIPLATGTIFTQDTNFIVTRENKTATPIVRLIYLENIELPERIFHYKEIVSEDFGVSWDEPRNITLPNYSDIISNVDGIYYASTFSDGNDIEINFRRQGKLVYVSKAIISSSFSTEITFNGIDDFGDYIEEGNYTYYIHLNDFAGNSISNTSWFYADYTAPNITEYFTNINIPPIPRNDLIITVNITESTNCTAVLYYKKDGASWQTEAMNPIGNGYYTGTIPGDSTTNQIQYYILTEDLAGNQFIFDNNGDYYSYGMPSFAWDSEGLFKESKSYSSSQDYEITIEIESDLEYVDEVIFRYSYDEGDEWEDLELEQNSPEFSGELDDIPGDLRELQYKVIVIDIYGNEHELTDTREVEFYPEVPSVTFEERDLIIILIASAIVGFVVAIGYIKLKSTSHEMLYKQMFLKDYKNNLEKAEEDIKEKSIKNIIGRFKKQPVDSDLISFQDNKATTPFTKVYFTFLCGTITVFLIALLISVIVPQVGILLLSASLLMAVFGYMILMSRDISINIYLERIHLKNVALEIFQIFFMFINIVAILLVGYTIDWFRYYLIESTFDVGATSIPRLYISTFAVFFTSLVLVGITTYIQLRKTVKNLQKQRSQGTSPNLLLYLKDQNSSRLITRLGYKTIVFLVTVLLSVITTTNLLTEETGRALIIIIVPFIMAGFMTLLIHRYFEMRSKKEKKEDMRLPFSDSKKFCGKCGEQMYLSNKYCGSCGAQQVFEDVLGTYVSRCIECNALINDNSKYCTECGKKI